MSGAPMPAPPLNITSGPAVSSTGAIETSSGGWNAFGDINYSKPGPNWSVLAALGLAAAVAVMALRR